MERFLLERQAHLDRWFFIIRATLGLGIAGFLTIDLIQAAHPARAGMALICGYVLVNVGLWIALGPRGVPLRWVYMWIDFLFVITLRQAFLVEIVVEPNATMVGLFTLLLLTYTIYGDPRLSRVLAAAAAAASVLILSLDITADEILWAGAEAYRLYPLRVLLLLAYLTAFCILTVVLAHRLRRYVVRYGVEMHRRLEGQMTTVIERKRREKFEELNLLKRDFIAVLSHELRTPLTPLRSSLELMRLNDSDDPFGAELLDIALDSTGKLQRLVQDYTELAELLTETDLELSRWNIRLGRLFDILRSESNFSRVRLAGLENISVSGDPKLLAAAFLALFRRAQLVSSSMIRVEGYSHGGGITVTVHDSESFLEPDLSDVLDDPFGKSSERTFVSANTGLELILARYSLRRTGGALHVRSDRTRGTTVYCSLPPAQEGMRWLDDAQIRYELASARLVPPRRPGYARISRIGATT